MSRTSQLLTVLASAMAIPSAGQGKSATTEPLPGIGHRYGPRVSEGGNPPVNWGRSAACAQMVRKNRQLQIRRARYES